MVSSQEKPYSQWINLASERLGAEVIFATDEFFAPKERLIQDREPVFLPDKYDDHGKWMDGWESRRKRTSGHDFCELRLGMAGVIRAVDIDTQFFTGNYPPEASLDACHCDGDPGDGADWVELLPRTPLNGDAHNVFKIGSEETWTHLRLHIYPDGGVARLRVYGEVRCKSLLGDGPVDLVAMGNGGRALDCSDEHYGCMQNLLLPGPGRNMGDGWETRRRRGPGHDWVILKLGLPGRIQQAEIDTAFFKGNYPDRVSIEALHLDNEDDEFDFSHAEWQLLLPEQPLAMDRKHVFEDELNALGVITHVRVNIFPDGGLSRVRLYGQPET